MASTVTISPDLLRGASRSTIEATERVLRAGQAPGKAAFVARAMHALATLADELDERALADAAGARSDIGVFVSALNQPDAFVALREPDPLQSARLRGIEAKERILRAEGGTMTSSEVAAMLGISRQAVDKRRRSGTLIGLQTGTRGYLYPSWQFDTDGHLLAGLDQVLAALDEPSPWARAIFLLRENTRLNSATPLACLREGDITAVVRAAEAYGEHGAA